MRGERLKVVTAEVAAAARVMSLLGPNLDLSGQGVSGIRAAASGTEAEAALETFCQRVVAVARQMSDNTDALANATARAAVCYQMADQYAMPDIRAGG